MYVDGLPRSSADIPRLPGSPDTVRSCATDLRSLAGDIEVAKTASQQLVDITTGTSWEGAGFDAFRAKVEQNPKPWDLQNAQNNMHAAAGALETLATNMANCHEVIDGCRSRIDALGLPDGECPEELRPQVQAIWSDAQQAYEDFDGHITTCGDRFEHLTGETIYAQPPPGFFESIVNAVGDVFEFVAEFGIGLVEGVVELVKGVIALADLVVDFIFDPARRAEILAMAGQIIKFALENPGEFLLMMGKAIVDWDTLMESPGRWLGHLVVGVATVLATGGAGAMARGTQALAGGTRRVAAVSSRLSRMSRLADKLDGATGALNRVDSVTNIPRRTGLTRVASAGAQRVVGAVRSGTRSVVDGVTTATHMLTGYSPLAMAVSLAPTSTNHLPGISPGGGSGSSSTASGGSTSGSGARSTTATSSTSTSSSTSTTSSDTGTPAEPGSSDTATPADTTAADTGTPTDATPADTGTPTDATPADTGAPAEATSADTGAADTTPTDTDPAAGNGETAAPTADTTPADIGGPADTSGPADVTSADTGTATTPTDTGAPADTGTPADASGTPAADAPAGDLPVSGDASTPASTPGSPTTPGDTPRAADTTTGASSETSTPLGDTTPNDTGNGATTAAGTSPTSGEATTAADTTGVGTTPSADGGTLGEPTRTDTAGSTGAEGPAGEPTHGSPTPSDPSIAGVTAAAVAPDGDTSPSGQPTHADTDATSGNTPANTGDQVPTPAAAGTGHPDSRNRPADDAVGVDDPGVVHASGGASGPDPFDLPEQRQVDPDVLRGAPVLQPDLDLVDGPDRYVGHGAGLLGAPEYRPGRDPLNLRDQHVGGERMPDAVDLDANGDADGSADTDAPELLSTAAIGVQAVGAVGRAEPLVPHGRSPGAGGGSGGGGSHSDRPGNDGTGNGGGHPGSGDGPTHDRPAETDADDAPPADAGPNDPPTNDPPDDNDPPHATGDDDPHGHDSDGDGSTDRNDEVPTAHGPVRMTLAHPRVQEVVARALGMAWDRSEADSWHRRREVGGVVVVNDRTGNVRVVDALGTRDSVNPPTPVLKHDERVLLEYHTHPNPNMYEFGSFPNPYPDGLDAGRLPGPDGRVELKSNKPSDRDIETAKIRNHPIIVQARDEVWVFDPTRDDEPRRYDDFDQYVATVSSSTADVEYVDTTPPWHTTSDADLGPVAESSVESHDVAEARTEGDQAFGPTGTPTVSSPDVAVRPASRERPDVTQASGPGLGTSTTPIPEPTDRPMAEDEWGVPNLPEPDLGGSSSPTPEPVTPASREDAWGVPDLAEPDLGEPTAATPEPTSSTPDDAWGIPPAADPVLGASPNPTPEAVAPTTPEDAWNVPELPEPDLGTPGDAAPDAPEHIHDQADTDPGDHVADPDTSSRDNPDDGDAEGGTGSRPSSQPDPTHPTDTNPSAAGRDPADPAPDGDDRHVQGEQTAGSDGDSRHESTGPQDRAGRRSEGNRRSDDPFGPFDGGYAQGNDVGDGDGANGDDAAESEGNEPDRLVTGQAVDDPDDLPFERWPDDIRAEFDAYRGLPYSEWPDDIRAELDAYRERHATQLSDHIGPGRYDEHVAGTSALFDVGGEFARFWDADAGTFDESAWANASRDERQALVDRLEEIRARSHSPRNVERPPYAVNMVDRSFYQLPNVNRSGQINYGRRHSPGRIDITEGMSLSETILTVTHEGFHVHQHHIAVSDGYRPRRHPYGATWKDNEHAYTPSSKDFQGYRLQPMEQDARVFADKFVHDLTSSIRQRGSAVTPRPPQFVSPVAPSVQSLSGSTMPDPDIDPSVPPAESSDDVECGTCEGRGIIEGIGEICYNCGGSGRLDKPAAGDHRNKGKGRDDDNGNGRRGRRR